jgi:hypothetical protein
MPKRSARRKARLWPVAFARASMLALATLCVHGCGDPAADDEGGSTDHDAGGPTYHDDVAPVLAEHCVSCHQPGGPGPFSLLEPERAVEWAGPIAAATAARRMPPFPADDAQCRSIRDARRLDDDAIGLLARWAEDDAPLGSVPAPADAPMPEVYGELEHVDAVLQAVEPYVPEASAEDHRCFPLDPQLDDDAYLTAYAVREGVPGIVHHVQLWALDDPAVDAMVDALDAADEGPGYACPWGHGVPARYVSVWAPSDPVRRHPEGTGIVLHAGRRMIVQIHYHDDRAQGSADQTAIELQLEPSVEREASMWVMSNGAIDLPPGVADTRVQATHAVVEPALLWGVRAHMHALGARADVRMRAGGTQASTNADTTCLLEIPHWQPGWQLMYFYEHPVALAPGDALELDCRYDTRGQVEAVRYGIGTTDEMCFAFFYVTPQ